MKIKIKAHVENTECCEMTYQHDFNSHASDYLGPIAAEKLKQLMLEFYKSLPELYMFGRVYTIDEVWAEE